MSSWCAVLLLAVAPGEAATAARFTVQAEAQELVVELAVGRLARRTILALERDGVLLLPAGELFDLVEIDMAVDTTGRLTGVRHPQGERLEVDPAAGVARAGDRERALEPGQVERREGELYVAAPVLEWLLEIHLHVDGVELRVAVTNPESLPLARRIARAEARRAREAADAADVGHRFGLRRPRWDGAVLDWSLFLPGGRPLNETGYRFGLGMNVLGGSLEAEHEGTGAGAAAGSRTRGSWLGVWPEQASLRQLGLGDVLGTGPRPSTIRGGFVTNSPFVRPAAFGEDLLVGRLAPGWEVELYRDGALLDHGVTDPDGSFRLSTPVQYGPNPLELRAYGPSGQVEVWSRAIRVQPERLPRGVFEYGLAAGRCRARACETQGNLDLHYGVSRDWTVRAGAEALQRDTLADLVQPYGSIVGTIAKRWGVRAEALSRGFAGLDFFYEPSPDLRLSAGSAWYDRDVEAPVLTPDGWRSELRAFAFWRPIPRRRSFFFDATARRLETETLSLTSLRVGGSTQGGGVRWIGGVRHDRTEAAGAVFSKTITEWGGSATVRSSRIRILNRLFVRGVVSASKVGLEQVDAFLSRPVARGARAELRVSWTRASSEPFVALGFATTLSAARTFSQVTRTPGGDVAASNLAEGSLLWNGTARRVETSPGRSLRRGGVGGVVFLDENSNGRYDAFEQRLPDVRLRVGPHNVRTDERGRFAVWDLVPFVTERIVVDSMSLRSPLWMPAYGLATIVVAPNGYAEAQIPIVPGAELSGRVVLRRPDGARGVGGVRVQLLHLESGRRTEAITFHDGEFYALGLAPGDYEVEIPQDVLGALRARPREPVRFSLESGLDVQPPYVQVELEPR